MGRFEGYDMNRQATSGVEIPDADNGTGHEDLAGRTFLLHLDYLKLEGFKLGDTSLVVLLCENPQ